jgi:hypothetical protein
MSGTPRCYCAASFSVPVRRNDLPPNIRFLTIAPHHESLGRYAKIALDGRRPDAVKTVLAVRGADPPDDVSGHGNGHRGEISTGGDRQTVIIAGDCDNAKHRYRRWPRPVGRGSYPGREPSRQRRACMYGGTNGRASALSCAP